VSVVSMPSWELFEKMPSDYRNAVLPPAVTARVAVEAGVSLGWERYVGSSGAGGGDERLRASPPARPSWKSSASPPSASRRPF